MPAVTISAYQSIRFRVNSGGGLAPVPQPAGTQTLDITDLLAGPAGWCLPYGAVLALRVIQRTGPPITNWTLSLFGRVTMSIAPPLVAQSGPLLTLGPFSPGTNDVFIGSVPVGVVPAYEGLVLASTFSGGGSPTLTWEADLITTRPPAGLNLG